MRLWRCNFDCMMVEICSSRSNLMSRFLCAGGVSCKCLPSTGRLGLFPVDFGDVGYHSWSALPLVLAMWCCFWNDFLFHYCVYVIKPCPCFASKRFLTPRGRGSVRHAGMLIGRCAVSATAVAVSKYDRVIPRWLSEMRNHLAGTGITHVRS